MIAASHFVAGAALGALCKRARIAVPVAFASHFLLDQIPHSCFNMLSGPSRTWLAALLAYTGMAIDGIIIIAVFILAWRMPARWRVIAAAAAAFLPDALRYVYPADPQLALYSGSSAILWVHGTFHCDVTRIHPALGFITQVIIISAGLLILTRRKPLKPEPIKQN